MRHDRAAYAAALAGWAVLVLGGCGASGETAQGPDREASSAPAYRTIRVQQEEVVDRISLMGIVRAARDVEVSPEISEKIVRVHCEVGDTVTRGEVLVELDSEERSITLQKKKAVVKKAEATTKKVSRDAKKANALFKDGVISDSEYDGTSLNRVISAADLDLARAEVMAAEKALRDTRIAAPFDGVVAGRDAEAGDLATAGRRLLTLVDISSVKIDVDVSEFDAAKIAPGNAAAVTVDSLPGKTFAGTVATVGLKADDATRTYPVEIAVANPQRAILPGMVARAVITSSVPRNVVAIPADAVKTAGTRSMVQVVTENGLSRKMIEIEKTAGGTVIVRSGLEPGDVLAVGAM